MMIMIGWMLMAMMMYFMRPSSMRSNSTEGKPQGTFHFVMIHPTMYIIYDKENMCEFILVLYFMCYDIFKSILDLFSAQKIQNFTQNLHQ